MKEHMKKINDADLPGAEERWEQNEAAGKRIAEHGYIRVGFDHFAHPDDSLAKAVTDDSLHRNFQGYTADTASALIGFGASAIGSLPQGYVQNVSPFKQYGDMIEDGKLPTFRGIAITNDDRMRREIIEQLMCNMKVDLTAVSAKYQTSADFDSELAALSPYIDDGLCSVTDNQVSINDESRAFVRLIAAAFDSYLNQGEQRHSRAV
jgi:oxygen-independent coproporphyrinogen-3 oxidase